MAKSGAYYGGICCCIVFVVLLIVLLASFVTVDYDELAFKKNTLTNTVNTDEAFGVGRYVWGLDHSKVAFPALYQLIELSLDVANADGVSVDVDVSFWYRLRKETLAKTYHKYGLNYETQIQSIARAIIRNTAVIFGVNNFLANRTVVRSAMARNISTALSEQVFVEAPERSFQLNNVQFSETIIASHLAAAIRLEESEKKEFEQDAALTRQETDKLVQQYTANTTVITRTAQADKTAKIASANAKYEEIIGEARGVGIADVIEGLGMDTYPENVTDTFMKLMSILDNDQTRIVNLDGSAIVNLN